MDRRPVGDRTVPHRQPLRGRRHRQPRPPAPAQQRQPPHRCHHGRARRRLGEHPVRRREQHRRTARPPGHHRLRGPTGVGRRRGAGRRRVRRQRVVRPPHLRDARRVSARYRRREGLRQSRHHPSASERHGPAGDAASHRQGSVEARQRERDRQDHAGRRRHDQAPVPHLLGCASGSERHPLQRAPAAIRRQASEGPLRLRPHPSEARRLRRLLHPLRRAEPCRHQRRPRQGAER